MRELPRPHWRDQLVFSIGFAGARSRDLLRRFLKEQDSSSVFLPARPQEFKP
jgi:hypothetical protein